MGTDAGLGASGTDGDGAETPVPGLTGEKALPGNIAFGGAMFIKAARISCGDPEAHVVPREGELDLSFTGWEMGHGTIGVEASRQPGPDDWTKAANVRIYLTAGGRWVAQVQQHLARLQQSEATVHDTPGEMFRWLTTCGFEEATRRAWEGARQTLPALPELELKAE